MTDKRNNAGKTRGRPFAPGNPGRPKGARHRLTVMAEKLMEDDAKEVVQAVLTAAKAGDMTAARLVLDRIAPPRKGRPVVFDLPEVETAADVLTALGSVVQAVAAGDLTPDEGLTVAGLLEAKRKAIETVEIERRIAVLEEKEPQR
ncbi:MAG: hypothetical protein M0006_10190 [Magnetospirillum sp.]|nr:hypothetical protein [Magnetospirillum sp.]